MSEIVGMVAWIQAHWLDIVQALLQVVGGASVLVHLTPTQQDDNVVAAVQRFLAKIALNKPV